MAKLGKVKVDKEKVIVIGAINVSPESFYKGSVRTNPKEIAELAKTMESEGADIIDVGAMSTAPYLFTEISEEEEERRIKMAINAVTNATNLTVSADTYRARVAKVAVEEGAEVINDVTGFKADKKMVNVISSKDVSAIAVAYDREKKDLEPIERVKLALKDSLRIANEGNVNLSKVVVDPGIGFFRKEGKNIATSIQDKYPWYVWDCIVISRLNELKELGRPICIAVSRKSFIGKILNIDAPEDRLYGSISATILSILNGARIVRTHDVKPTLDAIKIAEAITNPLDLIT
jgi:dihydropteroate synthase